MLPVALLEKNNHFKSLNNLRLDTVLHGGGIKKFLKLQLCLSFDSPPFEHHDSIQGLLCLLLETFVKSQSKSFLFTFDSHF